MRLVGGRVVTGWKPVTDPAVLKRLDEPARGQVWQADLKALGITDLQGINAPRSYQSDPGLEVFFQDQPMTLARYPNSGYMHIAAALDAKGNRQTGEVTTPEGKFVCDDPRPARWVDEKDVWLHGFWVWDWADLRIPLGSVDAAAHTHQPRPERRPAVHAPHRAMVLRRERPARAGQPRRMVPGPRHRRSSTSGPRRRCRRARSSSPSSATSCGSTTSRTSPSAACSIEAGRGSAFVVKGGDNVRVVACTIRNMGNWAVKVYGGTKHGVVGCDIYQTGQGGVHLEGGDRKTLTPAGHYADNNHIHHTARWDPVYQQAITVFGVGNRATHNLIDNVPHVAIGFTGNDQTIEYNEIHSAVFQSNDAGAIYTSPPDETWSMRGHKIRYNYLHNIHGFEGKGCLGVYLDDCFSSADISGNIFYDVATPILIGGGRDNLMTNNMFINCGRAFSIDARGLGWAKGVGEFATKELIGLNYKQPPWSVKYPELLNILEDEPLAPKGNVMARNICWGGKWGWTEPKAQPYVKFEDNLVDVDPRFVGQAARRLPPRRRLAGHASSASVPSRWTRSASTPSDDRASWPVVHTLCPAPEEARK